MAPHILTELSILAMLVVAFQVGAADLPKGVNLSFTRFPRSRSPLNCSTDGEATAGLDIGPDRICYVTETGESVFFSAPSVLSVRYQYLKKVQLWSAKKIKSQAVSFSTSYVIEFRRNSDRRESGNFFSFGGGWAFAITPDQRVGASGPESLGLFEIDPKSGKSLRGKKTKTVAIELDISRFSADVTFADPQIPHVGLDINSVKSIVTRPIGNFTKFVDRPIAVFIDYDAKKSQLQVRLQKLSGSDTSRSVPDKKKAKLYLSYAPLRLSDLVDEYSYVGFSSRIPEDEDGAYLLSSWKFSTKWVSLRT